MKTHALRAAWYAARDWQSRRRWRLAKPPQDDILPHSPLDQRHAGHRANR